MITGNTCAGYLIDTPVRFEVNAARNKTTGIIRKQTYSVRKIPSNGSLIISNHSGSAATTKLRPYTLELKLSSYIFTQRIIYWVFQKRP